MPLYLKLYQHALAVGVSAIFPPIMILLAVGLAIAIFQAVFQIEDATFALLPKTIAMIFLAFSGGMGAFEIFETLCRTFIVQAPVLVHQVWY